MGQPERLKLRGVRGTPYSLGDFLAWLGFVNDFLKELLEEFNMRHEGSSGDTILIRGFF